jgi:RNA polymerase sigma-70 factor (ECF subfamily)
MDVSDEQLAEIVARREHSDQDWRTASSACAQLYERHARLLLAFLAARVPRSSLEDAAQEIWQRIWQHLPTGFRGGNFRAWLYQIARNYVIDLRRKPQLQPLADEDPLPDPRRVGPEEEMVESERRAILSRCLQQLQANLAEVVRARLAGESYEDLCPRLGLSLPRAHKLFHQAKTELQTCVQRAEE